MLFQKWFHTIVLCGKKGEPLSKIAPHFQRIKKPDRKNWFSWPTGFFTRKCIFQKCCFCIGRQTRSLNGGEEGGYNKKDIRRHPGFVPITFTFSEDSNYELERCKGKTLLDVVNKILNTKSLLTMPSNVLPIHLRLTFPLIIWIFTEGEGDDIEARLPFNIFSTLKPGLHK